MRPIAILTLASGFLVNSSLLAQGQSFYTGANVTGQLVLVRTVNLMQLASGGAMTAAPRIRIGTSQASAFSDSVKTIPLLRPPLWSPPQSAPRLAGALHPASVSQPSRLAPLGLSVNSTSSAFGFDGITHAQQKLANNGNQFSVEPPSPVIAVGNGYVLEGVNNAVQVYTTSGLAVLPKVLSSNEVFGVSPAIDYGTGVNGVFPTDMRVLYEAGANRWFILQRAQDNDETGYPLPFSHVFLAVSQTGDPSGGYNIYVMDATNSQNFFGCPCFPDYMQIGADQYGFYVTANEYNVYYPYFVDATILAVSKASLARGDSAPPAVQFTLPFATGYEFAIQPAATPPGGSNFIASGGVEFFVSSQARFAVDSSLAVWAMTNTSSLLAAPNLQLLRINVPTQTYSIPDVADQRAGALPYGSSLMPAGKLAVLDGNDDRVLSTAYAGGRLYVTLATAVADDSNRLRVGGAYFILSPSLRSGILAAPVLRQGYLSVNGNHLLRPAIAVNPQGLGAIVFTLVGQNYYPSAAFVPIGLSSPPSAIQIAAVGTGPEDGFSGYLDTTMVGVARWGDYFAAVAAADGSIWMSAEYIPSGFRTLKANWGSYIIRYVP